MSRIPVRYLVVAVVAVLAALAGVAGATGATDAVGLTSSPAKPSLKQRLQADPAPALFPTETVAPTGRVVDAQSARADQLIQGWWAGHDHRRDDKAFLAWVEQTLPGPPSSAARTHELAAVTKLAATRTPAGVKASTWLETHGKKDLWKLYAKDQGELLAPKAAAVRKTDVKAMLKLTKTAADALGARYRQSAPYVLRPSLRPDHTVTKGQVCPCSYPSRHAAAGAAATTYLGALRPERVAQYRWTEAEIDYSRVYMAGHVPSDLVGGALLGDLVGDYYLGSRP
ncbi:MAG: hypothetical protein JWR20_1372 [Marmoricola sp.]|nr:hypothetical protein [Marmoricola sp.]